MRFIGYSVKTINSFIQYFRILPIFYTVHKNALLALHVLHIVSVKISVAYIISFPTLNPERDMETRKLA